MNNKKEIQLNWIDTHGAPDKDRDALGTAAKKDSANKKLRPSDKPVSGKKKTKKHETVHTAKTPRPEKQVDVELDLHGMYIDEALAEVEHHLRMLSRSRGGWLRLIHGQPRREVFSIYAQVRQNLDARWKKWIRHHYQESHNTGATLVQVKPDTSRPRPGKSKSRKKRR